MSGTLDAALTYAAAGIPVLPLHTPTPRGCSCARADCDRPGKHPRWHRQLFTEGLRQASTDPTQIRAWWRRWPEANVGLCTGVVHDVCDIDSAHGLQQILDLLGERTMAAPAVRTGSGGWHVYLAPTGLGNRVRLLPGVDWRGVGGYVVAPPSMHATGDRYSWLRGRDLSLPLPACPPALRQLVAGQPGPVDRPPTNVPVQHLARYAAAALAGEVDRVASAVEGQRNDTLNRAAFRLGQLVAAELLPEHEVVRELTSAALIAGLDATETTRTIRSGLTAGLRQPRTHVPAA
jgi:hypothetical protein